MMKAIYKGKDEIDVEEINSWEEEADCKIINHAMWSFKNGRKRL